MKKREKKSQVGWTVDEKELVVVDEADIAHNPVVGHRGFVGVTAEQLDVIRVKKILGRPADGVRRGVAPERLLID